MYITPPISITGTPFVIPSPRPSSGSIPVAIQVSNNSSWVISFNNGSESIAIDPYTRTTFPLTTITDSIPATPVYQAYTLVGAGYVSADWLLAGEYPSQPDGSLPISQLITQAIQQITSQDDSVAIVNPTGASTDLSVKIQTLLAIPPPVNSGSTLQIYTDPLGDIWVAKNGVNNGNWIRARDALHATITRTTAFTTPVANTYLTMDAPLVANDPYGLFVSPGVTFPVAGWWRYSLQVGANATAAGEWLSILARLNQASTLSQMQVGAGSAVGVYALTNASHNFNASDALSLMFAAGTAGLTGLTGQAATYINVDYLGG